MIDEGHSGLSVRQQCELLGLAHLTLYYEPAPEPAENLGLMRLIDEQYTRCPEIGAEKIVRTVRTVRSG